MTPVGPGTPLISLRSQAALVIDWPPPLQSFIVMDAVTAGALYTCEAVVPFPPGATCRFCQGAAPGYHLRGKRGTYCSTTFRPLNDGDDSLVREEAQTLVDAVGQPTATPVREDA